MRTDNRVFCYRPDGSCYAVVAASEWRKMRRAGTLDAFLAKQRDAGQVVAAKRNDGGGDTATIVRRGADHRGALIPPVTPTRTELFGDEWAALRDNRLG
jgi:hypothetical protein